MPMLVSDRDTNSDAGAVTPRVSLRDIFQWLGRVYEVPGGGGRVAPMEGLRGLAVMLVFFVHFDALFAGYVHDRVALHAASHFMGLIGNAGVDLFFVLSGYLIYGALIRNRTPLPRFLVRRVQRIYPAFLVVFALYVALSFVFPAESRIHGRTAADAGVYVTQNLLLLPGMFRITPIITVAWSLSYEFFFYLSAACFVCCSKMWLWKPVLRAYFAAGVWVAYLAVCFTASQSHVRALMFLVGIVLYEVLSGEGRRLLSRRGEVLAILFFVATLAWAYLLDARHDLFSVLPRWTLGRDPAPGVLAYQGPYKTIAFSISMFWITAYTFAYPGILQKVFSWNPLRYLGNMSYSYYLLHGVTLQGLALLTGLVVMRNEPSILTFWAALVLGGIATWLSATLLFAAVEKPFSFGKKI